MKVLSLFDGISVAQQALKELGIPIETYYASEIDKYAIQVTIKNHPNTIQLGDVKIINTPMLLCKKIDLMVGGSPCQDLSIAKKDRKGLDGERSGLFWEYVRILKEVQPKYFILENVNSMPKEAKKIITDTLGVEPIMINAALVSAQNRKRLFWVGKRVGNRYETVSIPLPGDRGIYLKDILETGVIALNNNYQEKFKSNTLRNGGASSGIDDKHNWDTIRVGQLNSGGQGDRVYSADGKAVTLSANGGGMGAKTGLYAVALTEQRTEEARAIRRQMMATGKDWSPRREKELVPRNDGKANNLTTGITQESLVAVKQDCDFVIRKLTPIEAERLQSVPDEYTSGISVTQRYKCLGNAFNCEVIKHIIKCLI